METTDKVIFKDGTAYVSARVAAQICSASMASLISWRKQPDPPPYDDDLEMYPCVALGDWIRQRQIFRHGRGNAKSWAPDFEANGYFKRGTASKSNPDEDQEERLRRLRADKLEMEIQEYAGTLVVADHVLITMTAMASRVKTRIMSIPTTAAAQLVGKTSRTDIQEVLMKQVRAALEELSGDWRDVDESEDDQVGD